MANQLTGKITKLSRYQRTVTPTINANFEMIEGAFDGIDGKLTQSQQTANDAVNAASDAEDLARQALQILEDTPRNGDIDDVVSTIPAESQIAAKIALAIDALDNIGPERLTPSVAAAIANMQALSNADMEALAQIDTGLLAGYSTELEAARDAVQDQALSLLNSLVAQGEEGEKRRAAAAEIRKETETRVTETEALARDMVAMAARVGDAESALVHEAQVRATEVEAVADDVTALNTRMGNAESGIGTANQTRASEDAALSQRITQMDAAYKTADSNTLNAANSHTDTAFASANTAIAQARTDLTAAINTAKGEAVSASNTHADQAVATAQGALSQQISGVSTTVGQHTTSLGTISESVNGLRARWGVAIDANGKVSGVQLNSDGTSSAFDILADVFRVSLPNGTGSKLAFAAGLVNGVATIGVNGDMLADGTITSRMMVSTKVSALFAEVGNLVIEDGGSIRSGQTAFDTGAGFWIGKVAGVAKFSIGIGGGDGLTWNGETLVVRGDVQATSVAANTITADNIVSDSISIQRFASGNLNSSALGTYSGGYIGAAVALVTTPKYTKLDRSGLYDPDYTPDMLGQRSVVLLQVSFVGNANPLVILRARGVLSKDECIAVANLYRGGQQSNQNPVMGTLYDRVFGSTFPSSDFGAYNQMDVFAPSSQDIAGAAAVTYIAVTAASANMISITATELKR